MTGPIFETDIIDDPLRHLTEGVLMCEPRLFPSLELQPKSSFDWEEFDGVMTAVVVRDAEKCWCYGSAVQIAPGIAIAAKHVIWPEAGGMYTGTLDCLCFAPTKWGLDIWRVGAYVGAHCDVVALAQIRGSAMPPSGPLFCASASPRMPEIGEPIALLGFVADALEFPLTNIKGKPHLRFGHVVDCFPKGRDIQMSWPCFAVSIGASGGMSGGPAFDERGRFVGIVSSSIGDGLEGIAFVSTLGPALRRTFEPIWPRQLPFGKAPLSGLLAKFGTLAD